MCYDCDVLSLDLYLGLSNGQDKVGPVHFVGYVERDTVHELVLEEDNGVGVADGGLEQTLCVLGVVRRKDLGRISGEIRNTSQSSVMCEKVP